MAANDDMHGRRRRSSMFMTGRRREQDLRRRETAQIDPNNSTDPPIDIVVGALAAERIRGSSPRAPIPTMQGEESGRPQNTAPRTFQEHGLGVDHLTSLSSSLVPPSHAELDEDANYRHPSPSPQPAVPNNTLTLQSSEFDELYCPPHPPRPVSTITANLPPPLPFPSHLDPNRPAPNNPPARPPAPREITPQHDQYQQSRPPYLHHQRSYRRHRHFQPTASPFYRLPNASNALDPASQAVSQRGKLVSSPSSSRRPDAGVGSQRSSRSMAVLPSSPSNALNRAQGVQWQNRAYVGNEEENDDDEEEDDDDDDDDEEGEDGGEDEGEGEGEERVVRLSGFALDRADPEHAAFEKFTRTGYWFEER